MKYLDEFRDRGAADSLLGKIREIVRHPWCLMEVCGGQTHAIVRHGIDSLLPAGLEILHGPGCPVCVTPLEIIDRAQAIAERENVILCSFGDMLRVPGSKSDLLQLKALGADIRVIYSPLEAVKIAQANPQKQVVLFAIGFETTAPANAMAVWAARRQKLTNFSALVAQALMPPAMTSILQAPRNRVQAFLAPGHVCTVMGLREYQAICSHYHVPIAISGFEPSDLLYAILRVVQQLEAGEARVENAYSRVVREDGNGPARALLEEVFEVYDYPWRGIGLLPKSGLRLRYEYRAFDANHRFETQSIQVQESERCLSGEILRGLRKPNECPSFASACTPERPLGATMVSSEGACASYYHFRRAPIGSD
jgi:hydrogenase expression/formation protein HypD